MPSSRPTPDDFDDIDEFESLEDEFTSYNRDPFLLCCLIEEQTGAPLREADMKKLE